MSTGGSPHLHSKFVHGCFRCEIDRDALWRAMVDEVRGLEAKLAALRTLVDDPGGPDTWSFTFEGEHGIFANDVRAILDGPTP